MPSEPSIFVLSSLELFVRMRTPFVLMDSFRLSVRRLRSVSLSLSFDEKLRDTYTITRISLHYGFRYFAQLRLSY
jgi:hypothetical protein